MKIIYKNKPVVKDWMLEGEKEFRDKIQDFIFEVVQQNGTLFSSEDIEATFFEEGVASVVALLSQNDKKYILKTVYKPLRAEVEASVFKLWSLKNINTPQVYAVGSVRGFTYFIMEYVESPTLSEVIVEHPEKRVEILEAVGQLFSRIHEVKIEGFGSLKIVEGQLQGSYSSLEQYLDIFTDIKLPVMVSLDLMNFCRMTLMKHSNEEATIGHFDYGLNHIFGTSNPIVFDPDPKATLPVMDLAFFLLPELYRPINVTENKKVIFLEYMKESKQKIDLDLLASALIFETLKKARALLDRPDERRQKRAEYMLDQVASLEKTKEYIQTYL